VVRSGLATALASFGPELGRTLTRAHLTLTPEERDLARDLLLDPRAAHLRRMWKEWIRVEDDTLRLEAAMSALAEFQDGWVEGDTLPELLDGLAAEFRASGAPATPRALSGFLFTDRLGGDSEDYYRPRNSNLAAVIRSGRGLPISLCLIYALVGRRVGVPVALWRAGVPGGRFRRRPVPRGDPRPRRRRRRTIRRP